jgi:hypothetical protein
MTTENAEVLRVEVPLVWHRVLLAAGQSFPWHRCPAPYARDREPLERPQVYKWVLRDANRERAYIGEAGAFDRRLGQYRSPDNDTTEQRVRQAMDECEQCGGTVELWFLEITTGSFLLNGRLIDRHSIGDKNVRLILENLAILEEKQNKTTLLNVIEENAYDAKIASIVGDLVRKYGRDTAFNMIRGLLKSIPVGSEPRTV